MKNFFDDTQTENPWNQNQQFLRAPGGPGGGQTLPSYLQMPGIAPTGAPAQPPVFTPPNEIVPGEQGMQPRTPPPVAPATEGGQQPLFSPPSILRSPDSPIAEGDTRAQVKAQKSQAVPDLQSKTENPVGPAASPSAPPPSAIPSWLRNQLGDTYGDQLRAGTPAQQAAAAQLDTSAAAGNQTAADRRPTADCSAAEWLGNSTNCRRNQFGWCGQSRSTRFVRLHAAGFG